jgi:hypothetical protein
MTTGGLPSIPPGAGLALPARAQFPGILQPSTDFQRVRDQRAVQPKHYDVDLSTARSLAAGTALVLPLAGNFLYVDQRAGTGYARIFFEDVASNATPVTIFAGALWRAPFTEIAIENEAQTGATLRIVYGMDIDALPISAAGVTVLNALTIQDAISSACGFTATGLATAVAANVVTTLVTPAANPRGIRLRSFQAGVQPGGGGTITMRAIAASAAPVGFGSQANAYEIVTLQSAAAITVRDELALQRLLPAGWGIYTVHTITVALALQNFFAMSTETL